MLTVRDDILDVYVSVPQERSSVLISLGLSDRIGAAIITGTRLKSRCGSVHSIYLETDFHEEDY